MIGLQRFAELAAAYGGDLARWPAAERAGAAALVVEEPEETGAILAQARALDAALDLVTAPPPSDLLARRILKAAPKPKGAPVWAAMAASMVLGVLIGFGGVRAWDGSAKVETVMSEALAGDEAWAGMGLDG
jgi:hypothetical protein